METNNSFGLYEITTLLLAVSGGFACSAKTVDLGNNPNVQTGPIYATGSPTTMNSSASNGAVTPFRIVDKESTACPSSYGSDAVLFTVASGRLFWLSEDLHNNRYELKSCEVDRCMSTLVSSESDGLLGNSCVPTPLGISLHVDSDTAYWSAQFGYSISMSALSPSAQISTIGTVSFLPTFEVSDGKVYAPTSELTVMECAASDCADTVQRLAMTPPPGEAPYDGGGIFFGHDSDFIYFQDYNPATGLLRVMRVRKDPNASFEVLGTLSQITLGGITVYGDNIYWVENVAMGRLMSCPKTGCGGSPTTVASGLNYPTSFAVDASSVYILEPPVSEGSADTLGGKISIDQTGRILKCPITGCVTPQVIYTSTTENNMEKLIVDDRFVYFRGNDCTQANQYAPGRWYEDCAFIAAIPK